MLILAAGERDSDKGWKSVDGPHAVDGFELEPEPNVVNNPTTLLLRSKCGVSK